MAEQEGHYIPDRELSAFANSLFGHLYFKNGMQRYRPSSSPLFREQIGRAVIYTRNATRDFNSRILNECGYGVDKLILCQEVCNLYPNEMYFKKLYFVTGFILDMMYWWYEASDAVDYSEGPRIWKIIFRDNFEKEFESEGGWDELYEAAEAWHIRILDGILPSEHLLPRIIAGIVARVRPFNPVPQRVVPDEAEAALERLRVGQMEIDDGSSDESMPSEEEIEKHQPRKMALIEGSKEESQSRIMDDRPSTSAMGGNVADDRPSTSAMGGNVADDRPSTSAMGGNVADDRPSTSAMGGNVADDRPSTSAMGGNVADDRPGSSRTGGNVAQTGQLGESSSGRSGEDASHSRGDRTSRKRRFSAPSETDPNEKLDSPSKAKMDKKSSDV